MKTKVISKQFHLAWRDTARGLIIAVVTPMLYVIQEMIPGWDADPIIKAGISAGISYLLKNFFEPTKVIQKV
jgi:hypothetical protein